MPPPFGHRSHDPNTVHAARQAMAALYDVAVSSHLVPICREILAVCRPGPWTKRLKRLRLRPVGGGVLPATVARHRCVLCLRGTVFVCGAACERRCPRGPVRGGFLMRRFVVIGIVGAFLVLGTVLSADAGGFRHGRRCCAEPTECCAEATCCPDPCCQSTCRVSRCNTSECCTPRFRRARHHTRTFSTSACCAPTGGCESTGSCCGGNGNGVSSEIEVDVEEAPVPAPTI